MVKSGLTKRDLIFVVLCVVFLLGALGAIGSRGQRHAREMACMCNLKKWGQIWKVYTEGNDGYFPARGGGEYWGEITIGSWPYVAHQVVGIEPDSNVWLCPAARKTYNEGGVPPFAAWYGESDDGSIKIKGSYCINLWIANDYDLPFWKRRDIKNADLVPLMSDGNWKDAEPIETDEPPPHEHWLGLGSGEMTRVCINRHNGGVNIVYLDLSVRKTGLKKLWRLPWHRQWDMSTPLPAWPKWMKDFKEP